HPAVGPELRVLFLRGPHRLVAPFRQWRRGLELDGEPGVGDQSDVAASGHSLLVVPQTDERPGAVPAVADRVGVDRAGDPGRPHRLQCGGEYLVTRPPRPHLGEQDALQPVGALEGLLQTLRDVTLAGPAD